MKYRLLGDRGNDPSEREGDWGKELLEVSPQVYLTFHTRRMVDTTTCE
jgi:hypothetical protein